MGRSRARRSAVRHAAGSAGVDGGGPDLLHGYFEPASQDERDRGLKQPTAAQRAIAGLVAAGRIRLLLTTNFDHLIEDALTAAGVPP